MMLRKIHPKVAHYRCLVVLFVQVFKWSSFIELAINYKDDGNYNFKLKKYHWAIQCYSEALKIKCGNATLNAQLFTNRAAAHYHLGRFIVSN